VTYKPPPRLILASESPRRRELLALLELPFETRGSGVDEKIRTGESPNQSAERLAVEKARAVTENRNSGIVLAADTVIDLEGTLLGKPVDPADARRILSLISGRTHRVITGVAAYCRETDTLLSNAVETEVTIQPLSPVLIEAYIQSGEPMDKAGAYAIQGAGGRLVESISGCYNNVVGFPLCQVLAFLKLLGFAPENPQASCRDPDGFLCPRIKT